MGHKEKWHGFINMTVNRIENVPKMHSIYYYAQRWKLSCTQISSNFALLLTTNSVNDHFNFARVSITFTI